MVFDEVILTGFFLDSISTKINMYTRGLLHKIIDLIIEKIHYKKTIIRHKKRFIDKLSRIGTLILDVYLGFFFLVLFELESHPKVFA